MCEKESIDERLSIQSDNSVSWALVSAGLQPQYVVLT